MKTYDCFPFFNELEILEIRLKELWDTVDIFVLCEANLSHTGQSKEYIFDKNKKRFASYLSKIRHVKVNDMPVTKDPWVREKFQRYCLSRGLHDLEMEDVVIVSDCDEIPRASVIESIKVDEDDLSRYILTTPMFRYKLNYLNVFPVLKQTNIMVTRGRVFTNPQRERDYTFVWNTKPADTVFVDHGGWHFSYLGDNSHAITKIQNFAHTELDTPKMIAGYDVEYFINNKCGHYGPGHPERYEYVQVNEYFPSCIVENRKRWQHRIIPNAAFQVTDFYQKGAKKAGTQSGASNRSGIKGSLAMFGIHPGIVTQGSVALGARSAVDSFLSALLKYGSTGIEMFCAPLDFTDIATNVYNRPSTRKKAVGIHPYQALLDRFDDFRIAAWHNPWNNGGQAFRIRQMLSSKLYPITLVDHCASYQPLLETHFLPLVMADTQPCDAIVCTSRAARSSVQKILENITFELENGRRRAKRTSRRPSRSAFQFRGQLHHIPLSVNTEVFRPRNKRQIRQKLGLPLTAFIILFGGRLSFFDKADLLPLLLAYKDLLMRHPKRNLRLVIAGTDRWRFAKIGEHYAKQLGIHQKVDFRKMEPAHLTLAAADVFVSPADSVQETFGLTPIESMACGIPQIVSDWDGYRDSVIHGKTGFLVPTIWTRCDKDAIEHALIGDLRSFMEQLTLAQSVAVDVPALREALDILITNNDLREEMGRNSRERAVAEFSWPIMIRRLEELWSELSAVAQKVRWQSRAVSCYPHYFDTFRNYASHFVTEETLLQITPRGLRIIGGEEPLPAYLTELGVLNFDLVEQLLTDLANIGTSVPLSELTRSVVRSSNHSTDRVIRHAMWLLKYDFAAALSLLPEDKRKRR